MFFENTLLISRKGEDYACIQEKAYHINRRMSFSFIKELFSFSIKQTG